MDSQVMEAGNLLFNGLFNVNFIGFVGTENYVVAMFVRDHFAQMCITLATIAFHYFSKIVFGEEFRLQKSSIIVTLGMGIIALQPSPGWDGGQRGTGQSQPAVSVGEAIQ